MNIKSYNLPLLILNRNFLILTYNMESRVKWQSLLVRIGLYWSQTAVPYRNSGPVRISVLVRCADFRSRFLSVRFLHGRVLWKFLKWLFRKFQISAQAQNSLYSSHKILDKTEKVKTVIEFYFLVPDFKSRGPQTPQTGVADTLDVTLNFQSIISLIGVVSDMGPKKFHCDVRKEHAKIHRIIPFKYWKINTRKPSIL